MRATSQPVGLSRPGTVAALSGADTRCAARVKEAARLRLRDKAGLPYACTLPQGLAQALSWSLRGTGSVSAAVLYISFAAVACTVCDQGQQFTVVPCIRRRLSSGAAGHGQGAVDSRVGRDHHDHPKNISALYGLRKWIFHFYEKIPVAQVLAARVGVH